jgi:hypothetical protein
VEGNIPTTHATSFRGLSVISLSVRLQHMELRRRCVSNGRTMEEGVTPCSLVEVEGELSADCTASHPKGRVGELPIQRR